MEDQKILNTPMLLTAIVELLNLQQMEISELRHEGKDDEAITMKHHRKELLSKAIELALETVSTHGVCIPVELDTKKLSADKESYSRQIKEQLSRLESKPAKKKFTADKKTKIPATERSYSNVYEQDQVKNKMATFSIKKNLQPEDLLKDDEESTPLSRLVRKSISHMLQLGKRLEAVNYLTNYIFIYIGMTSKEAHSLINELKEKFNIFELTKLKPVNKKRAVPKGKIVFAEVNTFKSKEPTTKYVIWPEDSKNNSIFDFVQDEFICMSDNIIKFREVSQLEEEKVKKQREEFVDKVIEKTKKRLKNNKK